MIFNWQMSRLARAKKARNISRLSVTSSSLQLPFCIHTYSTTRVLQYLQLIHRYMSCMILDQQQCVGHYLVCSSSYNRKAKNQSTKNHTAPPPPCGHMATSSCFGMTGGQCSWNTAKSGGQLVNKNHSDLDSSTATTTSQLASQLARALCMGIVEN